MVGQKNQVCVEAAAAKGTLCKKAPLVHLPVEHEPAPYLKSLSNTVKF